MKKLFVPSAITEGVHPQDVYTTEMHEDNMDLLANYIVCLA